MAALHFLASSKVYSGPEAASACRAANRCGASGAYCTRYSKLPLRFLGTIGVHWF
jgi:hypothetical protein